MTEKQNSIVRRNFIKMLYLSNEFEDAIKIIKRTNLKIDLCEIPEQLMTKIILKDNLTIFNEILMIACDVVLFLNSKYYDNKLKLFEYIYNYGGWKIIEVLIDYVDLYAQNPISTNTLGRTETIMHRACENHKYELIKKIFKKNPALIFVPNSVNRTPIHKFLIGWHRLKNNNFLEQIQIMSLFCSQNTTKLFELRSTVEKNFGSFIIPKNTDIIDLIEIIQNKETTKKRKKHIAFIGQ
jgi:hypothetical protein